MAGGAGDPASIGEVHLVWRGALSRPTGVAILVGVGVIMAWSSLGCIGKVVEYRYEEATPALVVLGSAPFAAGWLYLAVVVLHARVVLTRTELTWRLPWRRRSMLLADVGEILIAPFRVARTSVDQAYVRDHAGGLLHRFNAPTYFDRADVRAVLDEAGIAIRRSEVTGDLPG